MLTNEIVLKIFADYLVQDKALEVVQTRHGYTLLLWDSVAQDWSDVICCPTPKDLFEELLDSAISYHKYLLLRDSGLETLNQAEEQEIERLRQNYLKRKRDVE